MVYVTHDQAEAMALATDVAVMSEGRILQIASPDDIYARPEGRMVGDLIGRGSVLSMAISPDCPRALDWSMIDAAMTGKMEGTPADILVRPQDVALGDQGLLAVVESLVFEGERRALGLRLGDGQALKAFCRQSPAIGQMVRVVILAGWRL
jgi:iron(III) transport system ATP-binding protein